jgi:hypothetical protein
MSAILKSCLMVMLLTVSGGAYSNPIIVKLSKIYRDYSDIAIKFEGNTFILGRLFQKNSNENDVEGITFSFVDLPEYKGEKMKLVTRGRGVVALDVDTYSRENGEFKTYEISLIMDKIKVTQKLGGTYYAVSIELSGKETRNFGIDCLNGALSPDGIAYVFEPEDKGYFVYPSSGWLPNRPQYTRLYPNMYEWSSKIADENYNAIISDGNIEKHFDILFGQGLFEYIIKRNSEEELQDENVLEHRQVQSLILLAILGYYKDRIITNYSSTFSFSEANEFIYNTINSPKYTGLWMKRSVEIERKVEVLKNGIIGKK